VRRLPARDDFDRQTSCPAKPTALCCRGFAVVTRTHSWTLNETTLLGRGLTADVYAVDPARALKLFRPWVTKDPVLREFEITRAVHALGAPAPEAFEIVSVEGRQGILFEKISGHSMVREVALRPWRVFAVVGQLAELHAGLHRLEAPVGLPSQRDQIARWIDGAELPLTETAEFRRLLDEAPHGTRLCHGDLHPENVVLSPRGPVLLDWSRATRGHPTLDLARTSVLLTDAELPADSAWQVRAMLRFGRRLIHRGYLARYADRTGTRVTDVLRWRRLQRIAALFGQAQRRQAGA
jgi:uncharacterized protein (TIGR02172 family)